MMFPLYTLVIERGKHINPLSLLWHLAVEFISNSYSDNSQQN